MTLCLGACVPGHNDFSEFRNLPVKGWIYDDTVKFVPSIEDSIATGLLTVAIRHNNEYEFSNLWLEVTRNTPEGIVRRDTVTLSSPTFTVDGTATDLGQATNTATRCNIPHQ